MISSPPAAPCRPVAISSRSSAAPSQASPSSSSSSPSKAAAKCPAPCIPSSSTLSTPAVSDSPKNIARKLVVWGAGGHALVVADVLRCQGDYTICGFLDDTTPDRRGQPFGGAAVLGGQEQLDSLRSQDIAHAIIAIGDCAVRLALAKIIEEKGLMLATA